MNKTQSFIIAGLITGTALLLAACTMPGSTTSTTSDTSASSQTATTSPTTSPDSSPTNTPAAAASGDVNGSLADLFNMGGDHQCTWSGTIANQAMTGTVYVSGKKFHSEAKVTIPQLGPMTAFTVGDGTTITTWTSLAPTKKTTMNYDSNKPLSSASAQAVNSFSQKYNYHCEPWVADQTMFVVPQ